MSLPPLPTKPPLYQAGITIYNHALFRDAIPEEASLSLPVPYGEQHFRCFHYWVRLPGVFEPLTQITAILLPAPQWAEVVEYQIEARPAILETVAQDPLTPSDKLTLEMALYLACQKMIGAASPLSAAEAQRVYTEVLKRLVSPALLPLYRDLNPPFAAEVGL